jgi:hypothetical protein
MAGERAGFNFWLNKLNQFNGNFVKAEMLKAFITSGFTAQVFHCVGSRNEELSERLDDAFTRGNLRSVQSLRLEPHDSSESCWLRADEFCLSTLTLSET